MSLVGDDCFFFYNTSCTKGPGCPYRHVEEAKNSDVTCPEWMLGQCGKISCPLRHAETPKSRQNVPCYYETQASGCTKPHCPFLHKFPKQGAPPPHIRQPVPVGQPSIPPPGWPPNVRPPVLRGPPPVVQAPPPDIRMWAGPPVNAPLPHLIGQFPVPVSGPPEFGTFHRPPPGPQPGFPPLVQVEPVIINLNSEESDQDSIKGSPMKSRTIVPPHQQTNRVDNPLDYFLNAKPWVDPNPRYRRSPSPPRYVRRNTPSPRPGAPSPVRDSSPRRSQSPRRSASPTYRRRSISVDRGQMRRRSGSLDRSRSISPDWKDKRRIARRSRSPSPLRRRSKSPVRDRFSAAGRRGGDLRSRLKPVVSQAPKFEEIKLTGPKIVSLKKEKKEEEEEKKSDDEKVEDPGNSVVNEEIKSLEEIYRERALKSMMEAKRKRIMDQKKKRWESVKKTSESEKSDDGGSKDTDKHTSSQHEDDKGQSSEGEEDHGPGKTDGDSSSDSPDEQSDLDLAEDVDIELDAGDLEEENSEGKDEEEEEQEMEKADIIEKKKRERAAKSLRAAKSSIKSRLGLKAVADVTRQAQRENKDSRALRARSVKDRLGLRSDSPIEGSNQSVRSGVIKLNKGRQAGDSGEVKITRELGGMRAYDKGGVVLPRITIHNRIEERKNSIKQRLGLLEKSFEEKKNKKQKEIDEELCKLLIEEDVDIDASELDLLTKKEKKKLLKKLLTSQGREDDYEYIVKKKKKKSRRREREYDDDRYDDDRERRIKITNRLGSSPNPQDLSDEEIGDRGDDALESEDEIELGETEEEPRSPEQQDLEDKEEEEEETQEEETTEKENGTKSIDDNMPVRSLEEIRKEKAELRKEKEERLRKELEPVSLDDIRKKRALKRIHAGGDADNKNLDREKKSKRIVIDEPPAEVEKTDPPVRVTFTGDLGVKRRLTRIGQDSSKNENTRPTLNKAFKRERQIYVPPTSKQEAEQKINPEGREVIDYGDMFGKKTESKEDSSQKKISTINPISMTNTTDSLPARKPLRLNRGPPKVEVKDATVKTFAEIMAEKKRKRLLAQQSEGTAKTSYTPIAFDDSGNKSTKEDITSDPATSRLSSSIAQDTVQSRISPIQQTTNSLTSNNQNVTENVSQDSNGGAVKVSRWKRRKTSDKLQVSSTSDKFSDKFSDKISPQVLPVQTTEDSSHEQSVVSVSAVSLMEDSASVVTEQKSTPARSLSTGSDKAKRDSPEDKKKPKLSDSFFDDDLLMDDEDLDLDLANAVDHDELMREMDELLA